MPYDQDLAAKLREILAETGPFTEKKMFGGLCFMKRGKMVFAANHTGDLLVRVDPAQEQQYRARGAQEAEMGKGRSMSPNWLLIPLASTQEEAELRYWTEVALTFHATL